MYRIVLGIFICSAVLGCTQHNPKPAGPQDIRFAVDTSLVGPAFSDTALGVSFAPPKGWKALSKNTLEAAQRAAAERSKGVTGKGRLGQPELLYAWSHPSSGSVVTIASFAGFDTNDSSMTMQEFESFFRASTPNAEIKSALFSAKGFKVHQLRVIDDQRVNFKMVFSSVRLKKPIQFDFAVPRGSFPLMIRTIESVAGSVEVYQSTAPFN
ncbi:MAG: hypothetical protein NTU47_15605 [Ignavibacteriales bacterium]|nr:hypothetical protein [Ignavibacteriales bacterium]